MDLSIIIPVYNTPREALKKCFDSISVADNISYEALVVDDGSTNDAGLFCQDYQKNNPNFVYYYRQNQGVSAARNFGIEKAAGRYIMFVDSDDGINSQFLEKRHFEENWDVIFFDHELIEEKRNTRQNLLGGNGQSRALTIEECVSLGCENRLNTVWAKLFRREFLQSNRIRFDESMVVAEDAKFAFAAVTAGRMFQYINSPIYWYYYSYDHGNRRLMQNAKRILENLLHLYAYRVEKIDEIQAGLCYNDTVSQKAVAASHLIKDLVNTTGQLLLNKMECREMTAPICNQAAQLMQVYGKQFSTMTRLRGTLLTRNSKGLIWLYAHLRNMYLRIF